MATSTRFDSGNGMDFPTLNSQEAVIEKSKKLPDKLIVLLFNVRHPDRFTLESRMKNWWKTFETNYNAQFFKCVVVDGSQDIKTKFNVTDPPTVIFYRNGVDVGRIDKFEEADPNIPDTSRPNVESNDEKTLKNKIIELHEKK